MALLHQSCPVAWPLKLHLGMEVQELGNYMHKQFFEKYHPLVTEPFQVDWWWKFRAPDAQLRRKFEENVKNGEF